MEQLAHEVLVHAAAEVALVSILALPVPVAWACVRLWSRFNPDAAAAIREAFWASVLDGTEPVSFVRASKAAAFVARLPWLVRDQAAAERNPATHTKSPSTSTPDEPRAANGSPLEIEYIIKDTRTGIAVILTRRVLLRALSDTDFAQDLAAELGAPFEINVPSGYPQP